MENQKTACIIRPRFSLGYVAATRDAVEFLTEEEIAGALCRHVAGDWGDLDSADMIENEFSLQHGFRLFSLYTTEDGERRFYVITEADRSVTTVLLAHEY